MSKTIWKYPLTPDCTHKIPRWAKVLTVQTQNDEPFLWVMVDTDEPLRERRFAAYGTGQLIPSKGSRNYLGTFQLNSGSLVFHVFEEEPYE